MKKKIISLLTIIVLISFGILIKTSFNKEESSFEDNSSKQIKEGNLLSMMLETSAGSGEYEMVTQSSWPTEGYTFNAELSKCENGSELSWDDTSKVVAMTSNMSDKCYVYFDVIPLVSDFCSNGDYLATCIAEYADNVDSSITNIYHHDGTLENGIDDGSYRYAGANSEVNNYVCFGSSDETCSENNLFRIIGVIDGKVKLIKSTILDYMAIYNDGSSAASSTVYSEWANSDLNTYLNGTYLNTFSEVWQEKIATTTWKDGKVYVEESPAEMYISQMNATYNVPSEISKCSSKVALMYAYDYGFAASASAWSEILGSYFQDDSITVDWLFILSSDDVGEWLLSRSADNGEYCRVTEYGYVMTFDDLGIPTIMYAVRPVFFLESIVTYSSGTGTSSDPIRFGV